MEANQQRIPARHSSTFPPFGAADRTWASSFERIHYKPDIPGPTPVPRLRDRPWLHFPARRTDCSHQPLRRPGRENDRHSVESISRRQWSALRGSPSHRGMRRFGGGIRGTVHPHHGRLPPPPVHRARPVAGARMRKNPQRRHARGSGTCGRGCSQIRLGEHPARWRDHCGHRQGPDVVQ